MPGISGMGQAQLQMLQQMTKMNQNNASDKASGKSSSSYQISSNVTSPIGKPVATDTLVFKQSFTMTPYLSGSKMGTLPAFDGLTKAEPTITEDELRQAVIDLAKSDAAKGIKFGENHQELKGLIDRLVCGVSPDRKRIIEQGSKGLMVPMSQKNCLMGELVNQDTGEIDTFYTPQGGWSDARLTKAERDVANPFYELYWKTFSGKDTGETGGFGSKIDYSI